MSALSDVHLNELHGSKIADEAIAAREYQSIVNPRAVPSKYFADYQRLPGLLIPIRDVTGDIATYQLKPDHPRIDADGKVIKYEAAKYGRACVDVPVAARPFLRRTDVPLWITEGAKKVDSAVSNGIPCVVGLSGVWNWLSEKTRLPDWDEISLKGREVVIAFDSDVMTKESVRAALVRFSAWLEQIQGARVRYLVLPELPGGDR